MKRTAVGCAFIIALLPVLFAGCAPRPPASGQQETLPPTHTSEITSTAAAAPAVTETPTADSAAAESARAAVEPLLIRLQFAEFDPLAGEPALPENLRLDTYPGGENYYIVQFDGPVQDAWQTALDAAGVRRFGYIPEFAYLARMSPTQESAVAALPHVRWVGLYQPGYKIAPALAETTEGRAKLSIMTFPDADIDALKTRITELGGVIEESSQNEQSGMLRITVDRKNVVPLARLPGVLWIEPWTMPTLQ